MSKTIFNFNFNFHLNIFLFFKNWRLKKSKTVVTADLPQDNSTRILETQIYNAEKREELQEPNKQSQREARYHHEQALRRGRTFVSDPFIPDIIVNPERELKSLAESCHIKPPCSNETRKEELDEQELKKMQEFNKKCQRAAEARYHREQALKRGRTFISDPYLPDIIVNPSGRLKSLSESCHFSINELDKK